MEIWRSKLQASRNGFGDRSLQSGKPSDVFPRRIWKGTRAPSDPFEKNVPTAGIHTGYSKIEKAGKYAMREKILQIEKELNELAAERGEAIHIMILAVLTKRNFFILGQPGQAKTSKKN